MKKTVLSLACCAFLFSCGNQSTTTTEDTTTTETTKSTEAAVETEEKATSPAPSTTAFRQYNLDSKTAVESSASTAMQALNTVTQISGDFVANISLFEHPNGVFYSGMAQEIEAQKQGSAFVTIQDKEVKYMEGSSALESQFASALATQMTSNTYTAVNLYGKFSLKSGQEVYLASMDKQNSKTKQWMVFTTDAEGKIVSAVDMFNRLFFIDGQLFSSWGFASDSFDNFSEVSVTADNMISISYDEKIPSTLANWKNDLVGEIR